MAMIKCPECGRMISNRAAVCMGCGISKEDILDMLASDGEKIDGENDQANSSNMLKKSAVCPACGALRLDGQDICANCGISLQEITKQANCLICGRKISVFASVCPGCGGGYNIEITRTLVSRQQDKTNEDVIENHSAIVRKVRCVICKTEYNSSVNSNCPKCSYPVLTFCSKTPAMKEFVKAYRKKAGIQTLELKVGQSYKMGRYGGEDISWRVLATEPGKALLISEKGLDVKRYNEKWKVITWEECTLRKWLNTDFMAQAFSSEECAGIMNTKLHAEKNPKYSTNPGQDTTDQVFLLSIQEAEKYFKNDDDRKAFPTEYARKNDAYIDDSTQCCWWWLRSPGGGRRSAARVYSDGQVDASGLYVNDDDVFVRPALWINLES